MSYKVKFKESEIGMIPEDWKEVKFSDVVEINPKRELRKGETVKFVSMADIEPFQRKISNFILREFKGGSKFVNKDTLFARITPCLENGKTAFVDILHADEMGFGSTEFIILAAKKEKTDPYFVYYISRSPEVRNIAIKSMTGTSGRQRVENKVFDSFTINLPPLPEQKRIAEILSSLDDKIELNQQTNKTLEEIGQALFKHWFIDFEFPDEKGKPYRSSGGAMVDSGLGEIPKGWEIKEINDCGRVICGKTPPTKDEDNYGSDIPFITIPDMRENVFVVRTEKQLSKIGAETQGKKTLPPLTVCVSCIATPGLVALTSTISHTNQQINSIICNEDISHYFMFYSMKNKSEAVKIMGLGGTAILNLNTGNFSRIKLVFPPHNKIMGEFHKITEPLFKQILNGEKEKASLIAIRDSLLPRLMSGKIRVGMQ